jgi:hypothetical protein
MPYGKRSSRQRSHDDACSSRVPSVESECLGLAAHYGLNAKTVRKWRKRTTTADEPIGPKTPKSTVLTPAEEAIVVALRQKTLLPCTMCLVASRTPSRRLAQTSHFDQRSALGPAWNGQGPSPNSPPTAKPTASAITNGSGFCSIARRLGGRASAVWSRREAAVLIETRRRSRSQSIPRSLAPEVAARLFIGTRGSRETRRYARSPRLLATSSPRSCSSMHF